MKRLIKLIPALTILILTGTLLAGCQPSAAETALLQGAVTIGPINPVEIPGQPVIVSPEVFAARKIIIYDGSGKKFLREVSITQIGQTAAGYYTVQLAPGSYTIDINRLGIDNAFGLPKKITIAADETVTLDIDIDTGIR